MRQLTTLHDIDNAENVSLAEVVTVSVVRKGLAFIIMKDRSCIFLAVLLFAAALCDAHQGASLFVTQTAAPPTSGGPGITIKQWNATGSNNQTTQFTLAVISTLIIRSCFYKLI